MPSATEPDTNNALLAIRGNESEGEDEPEDVEVARHLTFEEPAAAAATTTTQQPEQTAAQMAKAERLAALNRYKAAVDAGAVVFIHVDIESGGEDVGIIQLSAVAHDSSDNTKLGDTFDMYVRPTSRVRASDWNEEAIKITGLDYNSPEIKSANEMEVVWPQWESWCASKLPAGKVGCLVAP